VLGLLAELFECGVSPFGDPAQRQIQTNQYGADLRDMQGEVVSVNTNRIGLKVARALNKLRRDTGSQTFVYPSIGGLGGTGTGRGGAGAVRGG
jgi:hypothetical protein